jgi:hypothetical protein
VLRSDKREGWEANRIGGADENRGQSQAGLDKTKAIINLVDSKSLGRVGAVISYHNRRARIQCQGYASVGSLGSR